MHARYSLMKRQQLTDFVAGWLRAPHAASVLLLRWFLGDDLVIVRATPVQTPAEKRLSRSLQTPVVVWEEGSKLNVGPQSYKVLSLARLGTLRRAQNSLFASVISFKGIRTQFSVDRSVATGELWEMWRMFPARTRLKPDSQTFKFLCVLLLINEVVEMFQHVVLDPP